MDKKSKIKRICTAIIQTGQKKITFFEIKNANEKTIN